MVHTPPSDSPSLARLPRLQSLDSLPVPVDSRPDPRPKLLIAYAHGVVQLMRNEDDMCELVILHAVVQIKIELFSNLH